MKKRAAGSRLLVLLILANLALVASATGTGIEDEPFPLQAEWAAGPKGAGLESVTTDSAGNVYAAGAIGDNPATMGDGVIAAGSAVGFAALIVKYDASGKALWAGSTGKGTARSQFLSVAADGSGNVYAAGSMYGGVASFGSGVQVESRYEGNNLLLVKFNSNGEAQWARTLTTCRGESVFTSVGVDASGRVTAAGYYQAENASVKFSDRWPGTTTIAENMSREAIALLARFDPAGKLLWESHPFAAGTSRYAAAAVSPSGEVYAAGALTGTGTYTFGKGVVFEGFKPSLQFYGSVLLVKYSASGQAQWMRALESNNGGSAFTSVVLDSSGRISAAGSSSGWGVFDFGNGVTLPGSALQSRPFVVRYDSTGMPLWARGLLNGPTVSPGFIAADDKRIYLAGQFYTESRRAVYDFGGDVSGQIGLDRGRAGFVAAYDVIGTPKWAVAQVSDANASFYFESMHVTADGHLIALGRIDPKGIVDLGNGVKAGDPYRQSQFIVKYKVLPPYLRL